MEQKKLKTQVFTMETVYNQSAEQPIDVDFTLPDYCPDINKILKCRAISAISSKEISGSRINIDGVVTVTVIYCDTQGKLCSYEYRYPFAKSLDAETSLDGALLCTKTKVEYINCRAVSSRKIDIHGAAGIYIKLVRRKCSEVICDFDDSNIELRRGVVPATSPMGSCEKYLLLEENIELGAQSAIKSILRYDGTASIKECKLLTDKAIIKGEMCVAVLCCCEDGSTQTVRATIPFSQLLEIEGITENCECDTTVEVAYLEIKPRISSSGEPHCFEVSAKLLVSCETYCNNDVEVVLDAYSRKFKANIVKNNVLFNKIIRKINESFNCKKSIEFPDVALTSVADMWCDVKTDSCRFEDGFLMISGTVIACIIAVNTEGVSAFFERPVEFEYKCPMNCACDRLNCQPQVSVASSSYTLTSSGNMELRVELRINATVYESSELPLISDVTIDEENRIEKKDRGAMTIYFAASGESVWDIARRYCSSVNEIKQINDISDDVLTSDKMILVPMN